MPQTLKTEIAFAIAPTRPDEAIRIVEGMKEGHGGEKYQAEAFGWLAVAIAPKDKARAFALIDRALAMPIDKPEPFGSYHLLRRCPGFLGRDRSERPEDRLSRHGGRDHAGDGDPARRPARVQ